MSSAVIDRLAQAVANLAARVRHLEAQEIQAANLPDHPHTTALGGAIASDANVSTTANYLLSTRARTFHGTKSIADNVATGLFTITFPATGTAGDNALLVILDLVLTYGGGVGYFCQAARWQFAVREYYNGATYDIGASTAALVFRADAGSVNAAFADIANEAITASTGTRVVQVDIQADVSGTGAGNYTCDYVATVVGRDVTAPTIAAV